MKYALSVVLVCLALTSCNMLFVEDYGAIVEPTISFASWEQLRQYVYTIKYELSYNKYKGPQETIDTGTADCMDYCILVGYFAERDLGMDVLIMGVATDGYNHAIVRLDGVWYEGQTMRTTSRAQYGDTIDTWTMKEILRIVVECGSY